MVPVTRIRHKLGFKIRFLTMANLKDELDQYLLLQQDQKKTTFKIDMKMPTLKVSDVKNLFGKSQPAPEANGWLQDTRDSCCPKMVRKRIHFFIFFLDLLYFLKLCVISVKNAANIRIYSVFGPRNILYDTFNTLHSSANSKSEKIRIAFLIREFVFHFKVRHSESSTK